MQLEFKNRRTLLQSEALAFNTAFINTRYGRKMKLNIGKNPQISELVSYQLLEGFPVTGRAVHSQDLGGPAKQAVETQQAKLKPLALTW